MYLIFLDLKRTFQHFITPDDDDDGDEICLWKTKKADGTFDETTLLREEKITIDEFFIRVPIVEYKPTSKIQLINDITKSEKI